MKSTEIMPRSRFLRRGETREASNSGSSRLVLERYRLIKLIGSGGFGTVWEAFDEKLQRPVALKEIATGPEGGRRDLRARQEAQAAARLSHPNIVSLFEYGSEDDHAYLVSELVWGQTLDQVLQMEGLTDYDIARIGSELCGALEHAHKAGVIHRDIKPQNVMIETEQQDWTQDGPSARRQSEGLAEVLLGRAAGVHRDGRSLEADDHADTAGMAKLMDFGIAHLQSGEKLTVTGDVVGTLAYMSPEQAEGRKVTEASDAYSLAITLYEAFAGCNPVQAGNPAQTLDRLGRKVKRLCRLRRDLPRDLTEVIDEALAPRPDQRPTVRELREALTEAQPELDDERTLAPAGRQARVSRAGKASRFPVQPVTTAAIVVASAVALVWASRAADLSLTAAAIAAAAAVIAGRLLPRPFWFCAVVATWWLLLVA